MITLTADQQAIVNSVSKSIIWKFDVTTPAADEYHWSMISTDDGTYAYEPRAIPGSMSPLRLRSSAAELGLIAPSEFSLRISDAARTIDPDDLIDAELVVTLRMTTRDAADDICAWKFEITHAEWSEGEIEITAEGFLARHLRNDYPSTPLADALFPSSAQYKPGTKEGGRNDLCVPVVYGTAYPPCVPVYIDADSAARYILGPGSNAADYTVTAIHSPVDYPTAEWTTADGKVINKSVRASGGVDYVVAEPIIADSNADGVEDAVGVWQQGDYLAPAPLQFSFSPTSAITSPADVIADVLKGFGIAAGDIDTATTFAAAKTTYTGWSLAYAGALWRKEARQAVLAGLLWPANSYLASEEKIELRVHSKTSVRTLTESDIVLESFKARPVRKQEADGGHTSFIPSGAPLDRLKMAVIPAKTSTSAPQGEALENRWVRNTQNVQRAAQLALQRKLLVSGSVSFNAPYQQIALRPEDAITVDLESRFGAPYTCKISEMEITEAAGIRFTAHKFSAALNDWGDLTPTAITLADASGATIWQTISHGTSAYPTTGTSSESVPSGKHLTLQPGSNIHFLSNTGSPYAKSQIKFLDPSLSLFASLFATFESGGRVGFETSNDGARLLSFGETAKRFLDISAYAQKLSLNAKSIGVDPNEHSIFLDPSNNRINVSGNLFRLNTDYVDFTDSIWVAAAGGGQLSPLLMKSENIDNGGERYQPSGKWGFAIAIMGIEFAIYTYDESNNVTLQLNTANVTTTAGTASSYNIYAGGGNIAHQNNLGDDKHHVVFGMFFTP